ncbi:MAG TPA: hypothetical protein VNG89_05180, partial [Vicinamibacterales bacterium]|nr:hypothetical protein [Vicinamibacterales bacterium]
NREPLQMMGAAVPERALSRHDGQTSFSTLTTISESPLDAKLLYTGSDDGQLYVTRDGGQKWTALTPRVNGVPAGTYVSSVLASRHVAGRVYATFDGHYNDDYAAYVVASDDFGQTWRSIASGLPATSVHRLREHPRNPRLLFVGHERGIHTSIDGGATWTSLNLNMPTVPVDDILIHPRENDLIVGTHGRGIWVIDNIAALEALTPDAVKSDAFLVPPAHARLLSIYTPQAWYGAGQFFAPNPEFGATIDYYLRTAAPGGVVVRVSDAHGPIRTLMGSGRAGLNRLAWDLRMEGPLPTDARNVPAAGGGFGGPPIGPLVLPGSYTITVESPAHPLKGELKVDGDPRVTFSDADRKTRQSALLDLHGLIKALGSARAAAAAGLAHADSTSRTTRAGGQDPADTFRAVQAQMSAIITSAANLSRSIEGYSGLPTADQRRQIDWAFGDARRATDALNRALQTEGGSPAEQLSIPKRQ